LKPGLGAARDMVGTLGGAETAQLFSIIARFLS